MIGGTLNDKNQDRVAVITVKKRYLRRRHHHRSRPIKTIPLDEIRGIGPERDVEIERRQQALLADIMNDLIDGRSDDAPHRNGDASCDSSKAPGASVLTKGDLLYETLLSLVSPEVHEKKTVDSHDLLFDILSDLLLDTPRCDEEAEAVISEEHADEDGEEAEDEPEEEPIQLRPIRHIRVKTRRMRKKKKRLRPIDILPKIGILVALCIFAWPVVSDAYKQWAYSQTISEGYSYDWEDPKYQEIIEQAHLYNKMLSGTLPSDVDVNSIWPYEKQLDYGSGGMMAWVEIPDLSLKLPIYHGADEEALMAGVGHMERTSLPVGGDHTKCAISGHTGMHNERMFDSLDDLEKDDVVIIHSMGMDLYYAVTYKEVVEPNALDKLYIDCEDSQLVLITCTPRGINSHRLLVHAVEVDAESTQVEDIDPVKAVINYLLSPTVIFLTGMLVALLAFFLLWFFKWRNKKVMVRVEELTDFNVLSTKLFGETNREFEEFEWETTEDDLGDGEYKGQK